MYDLINQIYHTDCFPFMRQLPDESVRLIITDPPYGIQYQNNFTSEKLPYLIGDTGIDYPEFAKQCYRILQNNSHAYFFTRFDKYPYHYECLANAGFTIKNCLVIEKGQGGNNGDLYGSYANNCEWVIFCHKGRRIFSQTKLLRNKKFGMKSDSHNRNPTLEYKTRFYCCWFGEDYPKSTYNSSWRIKQNYKHPTIKNIRCLEWLIQISSNQEDIVFDPFMGSGSTAIAAANTGRYYLGTEIDNSHYQLSLQRIEAESLQKTKHIRKGD